MGSLDRLVGYLSAGLNKTGALVVLPAMAFMMTADVVLRYIFNAPLSWGLEASQYMLLLVFIFGMVEAFRSGAHIRMDLIYRLLPRKMRRLVTLLYGMCALSVFALLFRKGYEEAVFLQSINEVTQYLHLPKWIFAALIVVASAVIVIFFVIRCWAVILNRREEVEDQQPDTGRIEAE